MTGREVGSQGIGLAIATALSACGASVVLTGRDPDRLAAAAAGIDAGVRWVAGDITTDPGHADLVASVPTIDVLVNNLGIFGSADPLQISDDEWRRYFETNVLTAVRLTRHYLPHMTDGGWGRVLYISSDSAVVTPAEMIHYGVS
jgi:NAD(P)-dependent dehydrogenase (short-subunit alcohol dehydrogenase family)